MTRPDDDRLVAADHPDQPGAPPLADAPAEVSDDIVTPARGDAPPPEPEPDPIPFDAGAVRARWHEIQSGFVDDPRTAVAAADELVRQALQDAHGDIGTEALRQALHGYRTILESLLDGTAGASTAPGGPAAAGGRTR